MTKTKMNGIMVNGSVRTAGLTMYTKNGQTIVRTSHSMQPKRRTRAQFAVRQRTRHTTALWQLMCASELTFASAKSSFAGFASLANRLPVVYIPRTGTLSGASLLMPGIPLCEGPLTAIGLTLGESEGTAALLTDMGQGALGKGDTLRLYTLRQCFEQGKPRVRLSSREVARSEFASVDGYMALVGEEFSDPMAGWALVRFNGDRCSTQSIVTRCNYYEQFTTEEALQAAAKSYGGLTE